MADEEEQATYAIVGVNYPRIRYGDEKRFGEDWHDRVYAVQSHPCHDCNAFPGAFHVPGCDMEECPCCGHQSISCACDEEELPFLRAENERLRAVCAAQREIVAAVANAQVIRPLHGEVAFQPNVDVTTIGIKARTLLATEEEGK